MTVTVTPNSERNTHHIKLSDGSTDIGLILCNSDGSANPRAFRRDPIPRSAIKMYTGEQRHSDLEPPWQDVAITDFSGGRGGEKWEDDTSKYWDGRQIDTSRGGCILAPMEIWDRATASITGSDNYWPHHTETTYARKKYTQYAMYSTTEIVATSFTATNNLTPYHLYFWGKKVGSPANSTIKVTIYTDSTGSPGAAVHNDLVSAYITLTEELKLCRVTFTGAALTASTTYWIVFEPHADANPDASNYFVILCDGAGSGEKTKAAGGSWAAGAVGKPWWRLDASSDSLQFKTHFAELKGALYCATEFNAGRISGVYVNGTCGTITSGTTSYVIDTNNSAVIADDNFNGGILRLYDGTGSHVPSPWGYISDTVDSASKITVTLPVAGSTDTTYSVLGADYWTIVTGHGLTGTEYLTDALSVSGAIYFPAGPGTNMVRLRNYWNSASTAYWNWTEEAIQTTLIKRLSDANTSELWFANRTVPSYLYSASVLDCTGTATITSLTASSAITVGDSGEKITGLVIYGEDTPILHVMKEGSIHRIINGVPQELRISGLNEARDERNGYATSVQDVYLYFSFLDSVERYFDGSLDDIGPNRDGGLPNDRRGMLSSFVSYPGRIFAAIDGGSANYSSIVAWNGQGWHEIWRAPEVGLRILGKLYIQPLPGDNADRLYFSYGGNLVSLCVVGNPFYHNSKGATEGFQYYAFAPGGSIETGWITMGLDEVNKLWNAVTVVGENLSSTYSRIYLDYKKDDDASYTTVGQFTISGDSGELALDDTTHNVTGKRIRIRIRMETLYNNSTPKLNAIVVEALTTVPHKYSNTLTFRVEDYGFNLLNVMEDHTDADDILAHLDTWASSAGTIAMSGHIDALNGKRVKIEPASIHILHHEVMEVGHKKKNRYICQATVLEVD